MQISSLLGLCVMALAGFMALPAGADTLHVPSQYPTIQAGLDAASPGDTVLVACGNYICSTRIHMRSGICLRSETGQPDCVLLRDNTGLYPILCCEGIDDAIIEGFTLYLGDPGVICDESSVVFRNCIIRDCVRRGGMRVSDSFLTLLNCEFIDNGNTDMGGAVDCYGSSTLTAERCVFSGNYAGYDGGAIASWCPTQIVDCTFIGNTATGGSGIYISGADLTMANCTFHRQIALEGAIWLYGSVNAVIDNTIIAFTGDLGESIFCTGNPNVTLSCCDFYGNIGGDWVGCIADQFGIRGNISEDPLFCDAPNDDLTLDCSSPCAPFTPPNEECDLIGAWPVGCGGTPIQEASWGRIKALFR